MLKQRFQTIISRLRRVFKKKSGSCADACTEASTDAAQSEHADKSVDVTATGSSSTTSRSSGEVKSSIQHDVPPGGRERTRSGSLESGRGSDDLISRLSESPTVPRPMLQLPTIVVGDDLDPIGLEPRRDSDQLPRGELSAEDNSA